MKLVISDLDGTLLDHDTYAWSDAAEALDLLKAKAVPVILCTSKTAAETRDWRLQMGLDHPYVVENGGAAFIPPGQLGAGESGQVVVLGTPYRALVEALKAASLESGCRVEGFSDWSVERVAEVCEMPLERAALAKHREYDEPFVVVDAARERQLIQAIGARGFRTTRGGRFHHILGENDKAAAVRRLLELYRAHYGPVETIGLGDGLNDVEFLKLVDHPVLIRSPRVETLRAAVPNGRVTAKTGPAGWNEAILEWFADEA
ncbi:HAD-IIB family hydrolase [Paludibaculum fermentans]|uniref:HAD-IIB family hydrolase n=1 Tax=Paludibaculum fermentans TaxID=1473598 RepID=A0A7S7SP96_PALFE|nr:HAD-IIB family hydrolase [Paludibaculum fermentans]QOY91356.1 HAD-IIB family hydrolase [Paludibaculum fermentans]